MSVKVEMGFFDKLANILGIKKRECNVLVVGLDNSGKSTILNHFKPDDQKHSDIVPTVGFNVERFKSRPVYKCLIVGVLSLSICTYFELSHSDSHLSIKYALLYI